MSIDARIIGIREVNNEVKIALIDRPDGGPAGQETLIVDNATHEWPMELCGLIGQDIWGGSGHIMLSDSVLAHRSSYTHICLVPDYKDVIKEVLINK